MEYSNIGGFPNTGDDTSLVNDHRICYWQLVLRRKEDENGFIHPDAFWLLVHKTNKKKEDIEDE